MSGKSRSVSKKRLKRPSASDTPFDKPEMQPIGTTRDYEKITHPDHYGGDTTYEVIKVLKAWGLEADALLWNAVKYIARAGRKPDSNPIDDLKKAQFYLNRKISDLENEK